MDSLMMQLFKKIFPAEILEYFDLVSFDTQDSELVIHFDEKDVYQTPEGGHTYRPNGFMPASSITDFPIRDNKVTLCVRRRRWVDVQTGRSVCNDYSLVAKGTRYSKEFAAFLKGTLGEGPYNLPFA